MTTSTVAEGKLMVAMNKGEQVPEGWIIDRDGAPTTDPKDFYDGGALLTVGAHKGSGLSIVTDLLAGAVSTGRSSDPDDPILRNNMLSIYIAPPCTSRDGVGARGGTPLRRLGQGVAADATGRTGARARGYRTTHTRASDCATAFRSMTRRSRTCCRPHAPSGSMSAIRCDACVIFRCCGTLDVFLETNGRMSRRGCKR